MRGSELAEAMAATFGHIVNAREDRAPSIGTLKQLSAQLAGSGGKMLQAIWRPIELRW